MKRLQRYEIDPHDDHYPCAEGFEVGPYCLSEDVSVLEAENERLLTDLEKLARKWISDEAESKGWFQSHNGNSCAEQLRAILNREQENQP